MRRLVLVLVLGAFLAVSTAAAAGATNSSTPPEVQGTYTYHDSGRSITVGYICPGFTFWWGTDRDANYYAKVAKGQWWTSISRHAPWKLDITLYDSFGLHLSDNAVQVLNEDAATIACP